jgi:hypothetical protein
MLTEMKRLSDNVSDKDPGDGLTDFLSAKSGIEKDEIKFILDSINKHSAFKYSLEVAGLIN